MRLEPTDSGTRITQEYTVLSLPVFWEKVFALMIPEHRDRQAGLRANLTRLGAVAAGRPMSVS